MNQKSKILLLLSLFSVSGSIEAMHMGPRFVQFLRDYNVLEQVTPEGFVPQEIDYENEPFFVSSSVSMLPNPTEIANGAYYISQTRYVAPVLGFVEAQGQQLAAASGQFASEKYRVAQPYLMQAYLATRNGLVWAGSKALTIVQPQKAAAATGRLINTVGAEALNIQGIRDSFANDGQASGAINDAFNAFSARVRGQFERGGEGALAMQTFIQSLRRLVEQGGEADATLNEAFTMLRRQVAAGGEASHALEELFTMLRRQAADGGEARNALHEFTTLLHDEVGPESEIAQAVRDGAAIFRRQLDHDTGEVALGMQQGAREASDALGEVFGELNAQVAQAEWQATKYATLAAAGVAGSAMAVIMTWYMGRTVAEVAKKKWLTPRLIISSSKKSWKQWLTGDKPKLRKMVFPPDLQKRLDDLVLVTRNISKNIVKGKNVKYRNLFLFGKPGTGKTMFAEELAKRSGMEYAMMSGSSFAKFKKGEGLIAMDELFEWARKSKKGLIIFIDEADSFLYKREMMKPDSEQYAVLNNFLGQTGTRSDKLMLVLAANHKDSIDSAMWRRIDDFVIVPLPEFEQRRDVLKLYRDQILLDVKVNSNDFIASVEMYLTDEKIDEMAQKTKGLSNGDLEGIVNMLLTDAGITEDGLIDEQLVDTVVQRYMEKYQALAGVPKQDITQGVDPVTPAVAA